MRTEIYCLAWDNTNPVMLQSHFGVTHHLGLEVVYCMENTPHGHWMNTILQGSTADVVGFLDADCVPTNKDVVKQAIDYAYTNKSFQGIAQASNHLQYKGHIFAAPAFFFIHRETWNELGRPTFSETQQADVAQNVSFCAEGLGKRYSCLYPTHWDREPLEGAWRLGNYGLYGIGTHFRGGVYHLYQGRYQQNVELFAQRCNEIVAGTFSTLDMRSSFDDYNGKIVP